MPQGAIKTPEEMKKVFADRGIDLNKPLMASCGSGQNPFLFAFFVARIVSAG